MRHDDQHNARDGFRVAAGQLSGVASVREAVDQCRAAVTDAATVGADLLVLSELALSPFFPVNVDAPVAEFARAVRSQEVESICRTVRGTGMWLVLPFAEAADEAVYNSAAVINPEGVVVDIYRKIHIPSGFAREDGSWSNNEARYFAAGQRFTLVDTGFTMLGVLICYDRLFPEAARRLALEGMETLAMPSANRSHGSEWAEGALRTLVRARAYENGCFVVSSSKGGVENDSRFLGNSTITSPVGGTELAVADNEGYQLIVADCENAALRYARRRVNWLQDRRSDLYADLGARPA